MSDWTAGYVADIGYTYGYYSELNPLRVRLALINQGYAAPSIETACELGFGQGLSVAIHAASSQARWYGTDFNPSQAGFAQELAQVSSSGAQLSDEAFADFASRSDLPEFDYIGLHGIWSWISDDNRAVIVDFLRRKLKVGGILYISYNTLPGWASFAPMRHLMTEHAEVMGSEGRGIVHRIDGALEFAERLLATNPTFSRANPLVGERLKKMKEHNRHYLAHEYFNRDWHPMHFSTMAEWLTRAKLTHAGSAHYLDHVDAINLTNDQQTFLKEIPDLMFRETVRDFMTNQQFRKDYWIKGVRKLSALEQAEALRAERVILVTERDAVSLKVKGSLGEATLTENIYNPILDLLSDYAPRTLGEIGTALQPKGITFPQILQAAMVLAGAGSLGPAQSDAAVRKAFKHTDALNKHLMHKARGTGDIAYLASPVTGGGVSVGRFQQLFLLALSSGHKQPADWAKFVWHTIAAQGQRLQKEGAAMETAEENIAELLKQAESFARGRLPVLKALKIA